MCITVLNGQLGKQESVSDYRRADMTSSCCLLADIWCWVEFLFYFFFFSDKGGIQGACVLCTAGSGLKKLLYQSRLLLLQLGDPLAFLRHLLKEKVEEKISVQA